METEPDNTKSTPKQPQITTEDHDQDHQDQDHDHDHQPPIISQSSSTNRSYECTFCKRGFSNAQALGGHMNIHRKDKAKLKQSSSPTPPPRTHHKEHDHQIMTRTMKQVLHQLPLFEDRHHVAKKDGDHDHDDDRKDQKGLSSSEQLDLELRLGPEPNKDSSSSPTTGTRKFF